MGILGWIIIGLIMGALAKAVLPGRQGGGWLATLLLGVVGAIVGGLLGSLLFGRRYDGASGHSSTWLLAFVGQHHRAGHLGRHQGP